MIRWIRNSPLRFSVLLMALALLTTTMPVHALDCQAVDMNDLPRECTFTEEYGQCLENARISWAQCVDDADDSWWRKQICNAGGAFDLLACGVGTPVSLMKAVL